MSDSVDLAKNNKRMKQQTVDVINTPRYSTFEVVEDDTTTTDSSSPCRYVWRQIIPSVSERTKGRLGGFVKIEGSVVDEQTDISFPTPALLTPSVGGMLPHITPDILDEFPIELKQLFISVPYDDLRSFQSWKQPIHWCLNHPETTFLVVTTSRDTTTARPERKLCTDDAKVKADCARLMQFEPDCWVTPYDAIPISTGNNRTNLAIERSTSWANVSTDKSRLIGIVGRDLTSASHCFSKIAPALSNACGCFVDVASEEVALQIVSEIPAVKARFISAGCAGPLEVLTYFNEGYDVVETLYPQYLSKCGFASVFWIDENDNLIENCQTSKMDARSADFMVDQNPFVQSCKCFTCRNHTRAYIRHLSETREMLGETLLYVHNLTMMLRLVSVARSKLADGTFGKWFTSWKAKYSEN
jgi:queuine tRNA-ribosyltransferase subunit QTRTD1